MAFASQKVLWSPKLFCTFVSESPADFGVGKWLLLEFRQLWSPPGVEAAWIVAMSQVSTIKIQSAENDTSCRCCWGILWAYSLLLNPFKRDASFAISSINTFCCISRWDQKVFFFCDQYIYIYIYKYTYIIYLIDPNHSKCKDPFVTLHLGCHLTKHHKIPRREARKGLEAAKFLETRGRRSWIFFHDKGFPEKQNPRKKNTTFYTFWRFFDGHEKWWQMEVKKTISGEIWRVPAVYDRWFKRFRSFYVVLVGFVCPGIVMFRSLIWYLYSFACSHYSLSAVYYVSM